MTTYILVLSLFYSAPAITVFPGQFQTLDACRVAGNSMMKQMGSDTYYACVTVNSDWTNR